MWSASNWVSIINHMWVWFGGNHIHKNLYFIKGQPAKIGVSTIKFHVNILLGNTRVFAASILYIILRNRKFSLGDDVVITILIWTHGKEGFIILFLPLILFIDTQRMLQIL